MPKLIGDRENEMAAGLGNAACARPFIPNTDIEDTGGVGGTLAGNALSVAAMRATLGEVLTEEAFARMTGVATRYTAGVRDVITRAGLPWTITQLGARAEYRFCAPQPRTGSESAAWFEASSTPRPPDSATRSPNWANTEGPFM